MSNLLNVIAWKASTSEEDEHDMMLSEYDAAESSFNDRARKGLLSPDEYMFYRQYIDGNGPNKAGEGETGTTATFGGLSTNNPHQTSDTLRPASVTATIKERLYSLFRLNGLTQSDTKIRVDALASANAALKISVRQRISIYQLFRIVHLHLLPRRDHHRVNLLDEVPVVRTRRKYKIDIIGVNATLHNDLGQKWYTTSGPLLIQQGSLVLETLENTKEIARDAVKAALRSAIQESVGDLINIAYFMHKWPRDHKRIMSALGGLTRFVRLITDLTVKALENKILDEDVIPTSIRKFKESALWVNAQNSINKAVLSDSTLQGILACILADLTDNHAAGPFPEDNRTQLEGELGVDLLLSVLRPLSIPVISEDRSGLGWTQLHSGGFGTAYIAEVPESLLVRKGSKKGSEKKLVKIVAKVPLQSEVDDNADNLNVIWKRIAREGRAQATAHKVENHPHILRLVACFLRVPDLSPFPALILPYCDGGHLLNYIKVNNPTYDSRLQLALDVARGVEHLHGTNPPGPIIHGDLRSTNVLIQNGRAMISDFGLSAVRNDKKGLTSKLRGAHLWLAPEVQAAINQDTVIPLTEESDMYSFGCLLLEAITGEYPFIHVKDFNSMQGLPLEDWFELTFPAIEEHEHRKKQWMMVKAVHWQWMLQCWDEPGYRPTAKEAVKYLKKCLNLFY